VAFSALPGAQPFAAAGALGLGLQPLGAGGDALPAALAVIASRLLGPDPFTGIYPLGSLNESQITLISLHENH
jgi:hypothetical protein